MTWQAESAAVYRRAPAEEKPVGLCVLCGSPVLEEHGPITVYRQMDASKVLGFIHGVFDCMDQTRCEELRLVRHGGDETQVRCLLPANHNGECYWGEAI